LIKPKHLKKISYQIISNIISYLCKISPNEEVVFIFFDREMDVNYFLNVRIYHIENKNICYRLIRSCRYLHMFPMTLNILFLDSNLKYLTINSLKIVFIFHIILLIFIKNYLCYHQLTRKSKHVITHNNGYN